MKNTLPKTLTFEQTELRVIDKNGRPWLTGADVARALGYEKTRSISNLYSRYADEFGPDMTDVTKVMTSGNRGNLRSTTRIYSPRGCHLIAMLARTDRAKAFRRWVLDVLEGMEAKPVKAPVPLALPVPTISQLLSVRDQLMRRGGSMADKAGLVHAVREHPGLTSAELAVVSQINRRDMARLVVAAEEDRLVKKGPPRRCAISGRGAITWVRGSQEVIPSPTDYDFERFMRCCNLCTQELKLSRDRGRGSALA